MKTDAFTHFFSPLPEPYLLVSGTSELLALNPAAARVLGLEPRAAGLDLAGLAPEEDVEPTRAYLHACARSAVCLQGFLPLRRPEGVVRVPSEGCALPASAPDAPRSTLLRLVPARAADEGRVGQGEAGDLQMSRRRAAFVAEASRILASSLDFERTLRNVARLAVPELADWCAVDLVDDSGAVRRLAVEHPDPVKLQMVRDLETRYPADPDAPHGVHAVMRSGKAEFLPEIPPELVEAAARDEEHLRIIRALQLRSAIIAPLATPDQVLGAITFVYAESGRRFVDDDVQLAEEVARRAAVSINNARLVRELNESRARLEEQAAELESQTEELQAQAIQLEEQTVELEHQLDLVRTLNEELQAANERAVEGRAEAERASHAKSQFLAVMSHELRTPLNAVLGYADLLDTGVAGPLNDAQRAQLARVTASADHLRSLIDQILTLARIEAGRDDVELERVDLAALGQEAAAMLEPLAARQQLRLDVVLPKGPLSVVSDPGKVRQILLNLLGNAVKFTESGEVALELTVEGSSAIWTVRDSGPGIAEEDLERIFEPFTQVDQSSTRRVGGTGLGLAVSRQLARILGGDVTVESRVAEGSTFSFRMPVRPVPKPDAPPPDPAR